ncbi:MAG: ubiquitin carboxyl-terminal hydrolase family protein, partial [Candidatus Onthovivens sp.]|nr:ubiquitin carboxyl-terminal hydrolase family protein [Candidatus Onthovivens sp.]
LVDLENPVDVDFDSELGKDVKAKQVFGNPPEVLIVCFERTMFDSTKQIMTKVTTKTVLSEFIVFGGFQYQFSSAVFHHGKNAYSGHYITVVSDQNTFWLYNDSSVKQVDSIPDEQYYIAIYEKKDAVESINNSPLNSFRDDENIVLCARWLIDFQNGKINCSMKECKHMFVECVNCLQSKKKVNMGLANQAGFTRKKMHEIIEQNIVELNSIIQQNIEKRVSLSQLDAFS